MQFQVPQFIEVEDKIFGPLTFKQFVYIGGGLGAIYLLWRILPLIVAAPLILVIGAFSAGLAFFDFNGRPLIVSIESAFFYLVHGKLYLWDNSRKTKQQATPTAVAKRGGEVYVPKLSDSRLHELAWSLDIKERIAAGVADDAEKRAVRSSENLVAPVHTAREALIS